MEPTLEALVERAKSGDQAALEAVLCRIQDRVYGLALRMLWHPADAEDASQEILIKVLTHLSTFRQESSSLTWVYHIASNHLLTRRKQRTEEKMQTFAQFDAFLEEALAADVVQQEAESGADWLFIEEIKIGCTMGMLLCLDREDRIAYIEDLRVLFEGNLTDELVQVPLSQLIDDILDPLVQYHQTHPGFQGLWLKSGGDPRLFALHQDLTEVLTRKTAWVFARRYPQLDEASALCSSQICIRTVQALLPLAGYGPALDSQIIVELKTMIRAYLQAVVGSESEM